MKFFTVCLALLISTAAAKGPKDPCRQVCKDNCIGDYKSDSSGFKKDPLDEECMTIHGLCMHCCNIEHNVGSECDGFNPELGCDNSQFASVPGGDCA